MNTELNFGSGKVATAGDIQGYVAKLSKLGKDKLEARIAKLKAKVKAYTRIIASGKFAGPGKPGPKSAGQAEFALRGCKNALSWHEQALKGAVATASSVAIARPQPEEEEDYEAPTTVSVAQFFIDETPYTHRNLWCVPVSKKSEFFAAISAAAKRLGGTHKANAQVEEG